MNPATSSSVDLSLNKFEETVEEGLLLRHKSKIRSDIQQDARRKSVCSIFVLCGFKSSFSFIGNGD